MSHYISQPTDLEGVDLCPELVSVLPGDLLAGNLSLHLVQPAVERVQVLPSLTELLLHRLLHTGRKGRISKLTGNRWQAGSGHVVLPEVGFCYWYHLVWTRGTSGSRYRVSTSWTRKSFESRPMAQPKVNT